MITKQKLNARLWSAVIIVIVGAGLLIAGFIVPPLGIIHNSVLVAFGEACTFVGSLLGIDYNYQYKIYKKNVDSYVSRK